MRRQLILFMVAILLAACGGETGTTGDASTTASDDDPLPLATLAGTPDAADLTATALVEQATEASLPTAEGTVSNPQLTSTALIAQATRGAPTEDCVLGTSTDPDRAAQSAIEAALPDAEDVQVLVTTDRFDCDTLNVVNAFTQITLPVISLNPQTVGDTAAGAIDALHELTLPQPATYTLVLTTGNDRRDLTFNGDQINDLLGLRGEALVEAIEG